MTVQPTDLLLVARAGVNYKVRCGDAKAELFTTDLLIAQRATSLHNLTKLDYDKCQPGDLFLVQRGTTQHKCPWTDLKPFLAADVCRFYIYQTSTGNGVHATYRVLIAGQDAAKQKVKVRGSYHRVMPVKEVVNLDTLNYWRKVSAIPGSISGQVNFAAQGLPGCFVVYSAPAAARINGLNAFGLGIAQQDSSAKIHLDPRIQVSITVDYGMTWKTVPTNDIPMNLQGKTLDAFSRFAYAWTKPNGNIVFEVNDFSNTIPRVELNPVTLEWTINNDDPKVADVMMVYNSRIDDTRPEAGRRQHVPTAAGDFVFTTTSSSIQVKAPSGQRQTLYLPTQRGFNMKGYYAIAFNDGKSVAINMPRSYNFDSSYHPSLNWRTPLFIFHDEGVKATFELPDLQAMFASIAPPPGFVPNTRDGRLAARAFASDGRRLYVLVALEIEKPALNDTAHLVYTDDGRKWVYGCKVPSNVFNASRTASESTIHSRASRWPEGEGWRMHVYGQSLVIEKHFTDDLQTWHPLPGTVYTETVSGVAKDWQFLHLPNTAFGIRPGTNEFCRLDGVSDLASGPNNHEVSLEMCTAADAATLVGRSGSTVQTLRGIAGTISSTAVNPVKPSLVMLDPWNRTTGYAKGFSSYEYDAVVDSTSDPLYWQIGSNGIVTGLTTTKPGMVQLDPPTAVTTHGLADAVQDLSIPGSVTIPAPFADGLACADMVMVVEIEVDGTTTNAALPVYDVLDHEPNLFL